MSLSTTITSKGQVTIPVSVRKKTGLKPGYKVKFGYHTDGSITLRPLSNLTLLRGTFSSKKKYSKKIARKVYLSDVLSGKV